MNKKNTPDSALRLEYEESGAKQAFDARLSRYSTAHARALSTADYLSTLPAGVHYNKALDPHFLSSELRNCGSYLYFRDYYTLGEVKLSSMRSCKRHLLCPLCAIRRGARQVEAYLDRWGIISSSDPSLRLYMLTLTVVDGPSLAERYNTLVGAIRTYMEQRKQAVLGRRSWVELCAACGAVWSYEVKRGVGSGLWHPHAHFLLACHMEPDEGRIRREWYAISGAYQIDLHPVDGFGGFLEVFKYALKFSSMRLPDQWEAYQFLRCRRMISTVGCFRAVDVPDSDCDDISALYDNYPYIERCYMYWLGRYQHLAKLDKKNC